MHSPDEAAVYAKMYPPPPLVSIRPSFSPSMKRNDAKLRDYIDHEIRNHFSYWNQDTQYKSGTPSTIDMCISASSGQVHIQKEPMSHHSTNFRIVDRLLEHNQHQRRPLPNIKKSCDKGVRRPRTCFSPEQLEILHDHLYYVNCLPTPFQYRQLVSKTSLEYNVVKVNWIVSINAIIRSILLCFLSIRLQIIKYFRFGFKTKGRPWDVVIRQKRRVK